VVALSLQSILQDVASTASLLNVAVLGVGYYFLIKLYLPLRAHPFTKQVKTSQLSLLRAM